MKFVRLLDALARAQSLVCEQKRVLQREMDFDSCVTCVWRHATLEGSFCAFLCGGEANGEANFDVWMMELRDSGTPGSSLELEVPEGGYLTRVPVDKSRCYAQQMSMFALSKGFTVPIVIAD
jgi:hypothetical protein